MVGDDRINGKIAVNKFSDEYRLLNCSTNSSQTNVNRC